MTDEARPPIPAALRRKVLVEAGHRCAIPTCRHIEVDLHHIVPWADVQVHEYENLIALCPNCHRRADHGDIDRKSLRIYKANLRFAHDKFSQFEIDFLFELNAARPNPPHGLLFPRYLRTLVQRIDESGYLHWAKISDRSGGVFMAGINTTPTLVSIAPAGQAYLESLGLEHEE